MCCQEASTPARRRSSSAGSTVAAALLSRPEGEEAGDRRLLGLLVHPVQGRGAGARRRPERTATAAVHRRRPQGLLGDARVQRQHESPIRSSTTAAARARQVGRDGIPRDLLRRPTGQLVGERIAEEERRHAADRAVGGACPAPRGGRAARARRLARAASRIRAQADLEGEVVCPTCKTTLDQSGSPIADRMKAYTSACGSRQVTASRIKASSSPSSARRARRPEHKGFGLLAWLLPLAGILAAACRRRRCLAWAARARRRSWPGTPSTPLERGRRGARPVRGLMEKAGGPFLSGSSRSWPRACCRSCRATSRLSRRSRRNGSGSWARRGGSCLRAFRSSRLSRSCSSRSAPRRT